MIGPWFPSAYTSVARACDAEPNDLFDARNTAARSTTLSNPEMFAGRANLHLALPSVEPGWWEPHPSGVPPTSLAAATAPPTEPAPGPRPRRLGLLHVTGGRDGSTLTGRCGLRLLSPHLLDVFLHVLLRATPLAEPIIGWLCDGLPTDRTIFFLRFTGHVVLLIYSSHVPSLHGTTLSPAVILARAQPL